ncbi:methyltransferase domain-containing protein [Gamsiella multidivaricata]|uniref:methyltransferase domain-containing protein n=1 Tax=Gamsiella multidivaricata TaxID=101098 RepID=UPI00221F60AF|nr:methyltransferase domain-containing protein [Gamsiella multidivaricata]KAI7830512.1 methyltransferase domain-containing protein [Gamsiella multidivaricata]
MSLYEEKPRSKCVIYSFGVNYETRFEGEMLDRTECEIWAYDASVQQMGPETHGRPGAYFRPYFVGDKDYVDRKSIPWRTLRSLMKENGHDWIDILKIDIEGSEYPTFNAMMDDFDVLPFSQLQIELHVDRKHVAFSDFLHWWQKLESKGLRPFWTEVNLHTALNFATPWASEYCFINTRGPPSKNLLLRDYEN